MQKSANLAGSAAATGLPSYIYSNFNRNEISNGASTLFGA